jgi:hypothetical protein
MMSVIEVKADASGHPSECLQLAISGHSSLRDGAAIWRIAMPLAGAIQSILKQSSKHHFGRTLPVTPKAPTDVLRGLLGARPFGALR